MRMASATAESSGERKAGNSAGVSVGTTALLSAGQRAARTVERLDVLKAVGSAVRLVMKRAATKVAQKA